MNKKLLNETGPSINSPDVVRKLAPWLSDRQRVLAGPKVRSGHIQDSGRKLTPEEIARGGYAVLQSEITGTKLKQIPVSGRPSLTPEQIRDKIRSNPLYNPNVGKSKSFNISSSNKIKLIQVIVETYADGLWGDDSQSKLDAIADAAWSSQTIHKGLASSFADPADVEAFYNCKDEGNSDEYCFGYGDNGIGYWGADTTVDTPYCALPREEWEGMSNPAGMLVEVTIGCQTVICQLQDTMPSYDYITNGCIIDLNPGAQKAFGLNPPFEVDSQWRWF